MTVLMIILLVMVMVILSTLFSFMLLIVEIYMRKNLSFEQFIRLMWVINWLFFAGFFLWWSHKW